MGKKAPEKVVPKDGKKQKAIPKEPGFVERVPRWVKISAGLVIMSAWYVANLPCPITPLDYTLDPAVTVEYQDVLRKADHVYRGAVNGPNSLAHKNGRLYTGNADGRIVELDLEYNSADSLLFTGNPNSALPLPCGEYNTEHLCGRPMGLGFSKLGHLIIADSYLGLLRINLKTQQKTTLSARKAQDSRKPYGLLHSVAVDSKKDFIYFTDSSYAHHNRDAAYSFLDARPFGRLFVYNPKTTRVSTLIDKLHFPTGVVLSKNKDFLLVAERTVARIIKYSLTGPNKGKTEVWASNLPIYPEEITYDVDGNLWVCGTKRDWRETIIQTSWLRVLLSKTLSPAAISSIIENPQSAALRVDINTGKILNAYTDTSMRTPGITSAYPFGDHVYFGSNQRKFNYFARITRDKLGLPKHQADEQ